MRGDAKQSDNDATDTHATTRARARSEPRHGNKRSLSMDGRKRAHTGAQNDESGKIRGLLARGQEQRKAIGCRLLAISQPKSKLPRYYRETLEFRLWADS